MQMVETAITRYTLRDDGLVVALEINPELERTVDLVADTLDVLESVLDGCPRPTLWDPRPLIKALPAGWRPLLDRLDGLVTALAVVVDEETPGVRGLFPSLRRSPFTPVQLFEDVEEALAWLRQHVEPAATEG